MATVVSLEGKRKTPSLEPLLSLCADDMTQVDREIVARMRSPVALIPELANHLVGAGGKRMRPLLTVAAARLCGYVATDDRHIKLATCVMSSAQSDRSGSRLGVLRLPSRETTVAML